jgi:tRNA pseudouridine55 synthase
VRNTIAGILNLNKPSGMTSRGAVDLVARLVRPAKAGHAGTLDPLASGVLVVCIGKATRLIEFVQQMPKRYRAAFLLGCSSPTEDIEGEVTELADPPIPTRDQVESACAGFSGIIEQRPPTFSAIKVGGQRAYDLARSGKEVALKSRPVTVYELFVRDFVYPRLELDIQCSAGTYVRSLGRDLAESLGTAAVMSELVRTEIGPFRLEQAVDPRQFPPSQLEKALQPPEAALPNLLRLVLDEHEIDLLAHGRSVHPPDSAGPLPIGSLVVALNQQQNMIGVLTYQLDGTLTPNINFIGKG